MQLPFPGIAHIKDHILTAILLIVAAGLMISRSQGALDNMRRASVTVFSYLEEPLSNLRVYRQALKTNTDLRKQNVLLLDELNRLRSAEQENKRLRNLLEFGRNSTLSLYPVQIVGKELNQTFNLLTVDAGKENGIQEGMPLMGAEGLAGKVIITSQNYSQVMPLYSTLFKVSAKLQHSNAFGIVSWSEKLINELQLNHVPQTVDVDSGEVVVTSGYSNQFPANLPIGTVSRTVPQEGKETQKIFLTPFVDLYSIGAGFIVKSKPDTARTKLDEEYKEALQ
ncbi:MAG TPA: rod shape-determining protein MreC [Fodinibius sp.]|nr:rod shape-determining protein MreC [Fodinibius sp.]